MRHALFIRATTPLLILAVVLCSVFGFIPQASARSLATVVVTDCTDGGLRTAIANAPSEATITFQCPTNPTTITLSSTLEITKNLTLDGSGQSITLSGGGNVGVLLIDNGMQFTLKALTIANGSFANGGGIYNDGTVSISNSTIADNTSPSSGGGIFNNFGTVSISNSTIANNTADEGGGISNNFGTVGISNSTIANNTAGEGAGIWNDGTMSISNSTIANNTAGARAGIWNDFGTVSISSSTIANNSRGGLLNFGTVSIAQSIVANNQNSNCASPITDLGYNLESGTDCGFTASTDLQANPQFQGGLQNNGGPTQTIALQPTSPAVDKIPVNTGPGCVAGGTDQRGYPRPDYVLLLLPESTCDIGAYEVQDLL